MHSMFLLCLRISSSAISRLAEAPRESSRMSVLLSSNGETVTSAGYTSVSLKRASGKRAF